MLAGFSVEPAGRRQSVVQSGASSLGALQVEGLLGALEQEKVYNAPIAKKSWGYKQKKQSKGLLVWTGHLGLVNYHLKVVY